MKTRLISWILCLLMIVSLMAGCGTKEQPADATQSATTAESTAAEEVEGTAAQPAEAKTYDEFITVDVFATQANYQGIQPGWYAKILKDKFNMELNIIAPNVAGGGDTLYLTRSAAGNLGDLITYQIYGGKLQDMATAGLLVDISQYMDGHQNLAKYKEAIDFTNESNCDIPGTWVIPSEVSERPATEPFTDLQLNFGQYTRWDAYKQLGYPEMNTIEDVLPVMQQIQGIVPTSDSGKKTYAFSIFKDWDENSITAGNLIAQMYGWDAVGFLNVMADDSAEPVSMVEDNSAYVRGLKLFFKANQMGLLDPESPTQNYDTLTQKYNDGVVLWSPCPWMSAGYNTDEHKAAGKYYDTMPVKDIKYETWGCYAKGNPQVGIMVGSNAKDPERMVDYIDWMYSPEGIPTTDGAYGTGEQGVIWDMVDGKPELTELGYKCITDGANTQMPEEFGGGTFKDGRAQISMKIISGGEINPNTGFPYDYKLWDSWTQRNVTPIEKDWQDHMGAKNAFEYFKKNNMMAVNPGSGYAFPTETSDYTTIKNQVKEVIKEYSWKAIYAKDEADFNGLIKKMRDTSNGLGLEQLLAVDRETAEAQKQARIAVGAK